MLTEELDSSEGRKRKSWPPSLWLGVVLVGFLVFVMLFGESIAPFDPQQTSPNSLAGPDSSHWLGTDSVGRDVLSRVLAGTRVTMLIVFASVAAAFAAGSLIGLFAGYFGGRFDETVMRVLDVILAFPPFLLAITVVAVLGNTPTNLVLTIAVVYTPMMARVVRGPVLSIRSWDHVTAARIVGLKDGTIMLKHVLPIAISPVLVETSLMIARVVFTITALSFLGLGTPPPAPNWGTMLSDARQFMELAPFSAVAPAAAIVFTSLTFIVLAAGLRKLLNVQGTR